MNNEYAKMITDRISDGCKAYLITTMYNYLPDQGKELIMHQGMEILYSRILRHEIRHSNRIQDLYKWPMLLYHLDTPSVKTLNGILCDVTINDGLHIHAILSVPPNARHYNAYRDYFNSKISGPLIDNHREFRRLHIEEITHTPKRVIQYMSKSSNQSPNENFEFEILPKVQSEMSLPLKKCSRMQDA